MALLSITANDIDKAGTTVDLDLPAAWLDAELGDTDVRGSAGHVRARLSRTGDDIVVRGKVDGTLTAPCSRCLADVPFTVQGELSLFLQASKTASAPKASAPKASAPKAGASHPRAASAADGAPRPRAAAKPPEEYEFSADEAEHDTYDGETVVLDAFVREALLLEVPNFPLCSEACPGISAPASAEGETAIDPRLAPLSALRDKLAKTQSSKSRGSSPPPQKKKNKE